jgi:hypothetical protein
LVLDSVHCDVRELLVPFALDGDEGTVINPRIIITLDYVTMPRVGNCFHSAAWFMGGTYPIVGEDTYRMFVLGSYLGRASFNRAAICITPISVCLCAADGCVASAPAVFKYNSITVDIIRCSPL